MLQEDQIKTNQERNIQRSLANLTLFIERKDHSLSAFYYCADQLISYSKNNNAEDIRSQYFHEFKEQIVFLKNDTEQMVGSKIIQKKHEKDIFEEIMDIVNSKLFLQCMNTTLKGQKIKTHQNSLASSEDVTVEEINKKKQQSAQKEMAWKKLKIAYEEHRIDEAYELMKDFQGKYKPNHQQQQLFSTIELQYDTMIGFYRQFDQEGWIMDLDENGVTLEYKIFEEDKQIAIRIVSEFDITIVNFLAILCEMDLFGKYVPFCYDTKQLKIVSRNQKIGTSKIYIPLLTDRQTYFYAVGYDRYQHNGSVFIYSKTINEDKLYQEKYGYTVPEQTDYIRLQYKFFIVEYVPVSKGRAKVRLASKVDMKLNFIPQFIVNVSARKFALNYFKNIIKMNKKFKGSDWQKKINENPDFYRFFQKKIDEYLS